MRCAYSCCVTRQTDRAVVAGRREAASPEPITTTGSMDSGLACFARAPE